MCTVSWSGGSGGLSLCFNRDERKAREEALVPAEYARGGNRCVAAIDPVGGGTWLSASERGFCVFLLNNYAASKGAAGGARAGLTSRGRLPLELAGCEDCEEAVRTFEGMALACFEAFFIGFADGESVRVFSWDGVRLAELSLAERFLTTSSYRTLDVESYRKSRYRELLGEVGELSDELRRLFHTEVSHADAAFNAMMLREDSKTHSVTTVRIDREGIWFRYEATQGEARELGKATELTLARKL